MNVLIAAPSCSEFGAFWVDSGGGAGQGWAGVQVFRIWVGSNS